MKTEISIERIKNGVLLIDLLVETGLTKSKSESRRMIKQSAVRINNTVIENWEHALILSHFVGHNSLMLRVGNTGAHEVTVRTKKIDPALRKINMLQKELSNEKFVRYASAHVVETARRWLAKLQSEQK